MILGHPLAATGTLRGPRATCARSQAPEPAPPIGGGGIGRSAGGGRRDDDAGNGRAGPAPASLAALAAAAKLGDLARPTGPDTGAEEARALVGLLLVAAAMAALVALPRSIPQASPRDVHGRPWIVRGRPDATQPAKVA
jgi:hypothetical protein